MKDIEIWKKVMAYENIYEVSNLGRIKSLKWGKERILNGGLTNKGYLQVGLCKDGIVKKRTIHQIIAEAFLGHIPCGYEFVIDHIDKNRLNNSLDNLRVTTQRINTDQKHLESTSKYTGVFWNKKRNKWISSIFIDKKVIHLGCFTDEKEASEYYENALKAYLNNKEIVVKKHISKGYCLDRRTNKWLASIYLNGKSKRIGYFENEIDAHNAYQKEIINLKRKN